ncbi:MAG: 3-phosphoshikimate 1-carboxyvinyltransferase [Acidobacteriota bacterium]
MNIEVGSQGPLRGDVNVPSDKSISHRTLMLGAIANGRSTVRNLLRGADVLSTMSCLQALGVRITDSPELIVIEGRGLEGLHAPSGMLDCGNSGTTMRLLSGILASRDFTTTLTGDQSLRRRPMARIIEPLTMMGADIRGHEGSKLAPLTIQGGRLHSIQYRLPMASAQVKSAVLLAGLGAEGRTSVIEEVPSRDHTERMLKAMGADIVNADGRIEIASGSQLAPQDWIVPGDISSAAFFMVGAAITPGSEVCLKGVGVNWTRSAVIEVLQAMGADIRIENLQEIGGEPVADIIVRHSTLQPTEISGSIIPRLIDEIPVLAVAMAAAQGTSIVRDAGELRAKESDRIVIMVESLRKLGVDAEELEDGFTIRGSGLIPGGNTVCSHDDHRIAMSMAIAGLHSVKPVDIEGFESVSISYPGFLEDLKKLV